MSIRRDLERELEGWNVQAVPGPDPIPHRHAVDVVLRPPVHGPEVHDVRAVAEAHVHGHGCAAGVRHGDGLGGHGMGVEAAPDDERDQRLDGLRIALQGLRGAVGPGDQQGIGEEILAVQALPEALPVGGHHGGAEGRIAGDLLVHLVGAGPGIGLVMCGDLVGIHGRVADPVQGERHQGLAVADRTGVHRVPCLLFHQLGHELVGHPEFGREQGPRLGRERHVRGPVHAHARTG